ncbi:hypothetical protein FN846DRAFT_908729 [Sphaerosporella brunnea]|uniref:Uncharacterized protein n=1 Tax=Sphaerosporella brunnea TaxID=1250544 RepID=A0A5J5ESW2_9PEZI|nr:hypothetical protein FN846DRAFT_908729 [Sphaerosporella brunnea]
MPPRTLTLPVDPPSRWTWWGCCWSPPANSTTTISHPTRTWTTAGGSTPTTNTDAAVSKDDRLRRQNRQNGRDPGRSSDQVGNVGQAVKPQVLGQIIKQNTNPTDTGSVKAMTWPKRKIDSMDASLNQLKILSVPTPEQPPTPPVALPTPVCCPTSIHNARLRELVDSTLRRRVETVAIPVTSVQQFDRAATYLWRKVRARWQLFASRSRLAKTLGCTVSTSTDYVLAVMPAPNETHEILANVFVNDILVAVRSPSFLPAPWPRTVIRSRHSASVSCDYGGDHFKCMPDGSLIFGNHVGNDEVPWLALEVGDCESTAHVQDKMRKYLLGSLGKIRYGVCLNLLTSVRFNRDIVQPKQHSRRMAMVKSEIRRLQSAGERRSKVSLKEQAERNIARRLRKEPDLLRDPEDDVILQRAGKYVLATISVFSSGLITLPDGALGRRLTTHVPTTPIWPYQSVDGFSIRWQDINHPHLPGQQMLAGAFVSFAGWHSMVQAVVTVNHRYLAQ